MSVSFNELSKDEQGILFLAPVQAAILVGGADEDFDKIERRVAKELTHIKSYTSKGDLKSFYTIVAERFMKDLNGLMSYYPLTAQERNKVIMEELAEVREILDKMGERFRTNFAHTLVEIGRYVAEASGGVLGMLSINQQEYEAILDLEKVMKEPVLKNS